MCVRRFSSGDLSAEADDADPSMAPGDRPPATGAQSQQRAQQRQYASKPSRSQAATPASEAADMRLEFQQQPQQQQQPPSSRTISAPTSPAKTRDSILQRVQSLTDAAKEKASSISNDIKCECSPHPRPSPVPSPGPVRGGFHGLGGKTLDLRRLSVGLLEREELGEK